MQSRDVAAAGRERLAATITEYARRAGRLEGEQTFSWDVGTFTGDDVQLTDAGRRRPVRAAADRRERGRRVAADGGALAPPVRLTRAGGHATVTCTITRVVHVPDNARSSQRAQVAEAAGLGGIAIWALGYEPLDLWTALARRLTLGLKRRHTPQ